MLTSQKRRRVHGFLDSQWSNLCYLQEKAAGEKAVGERLLVKSLWVKSVELGEKYTCEKSVGKKNYR